MLHFTPGPGAEPVQAPHLPNLSGCRIRPLVEGDADAFRDHLLRLDERSRRLRFGAPVNDDFIRAYAGRSESVRRVGLFDGDVLRGVAELHLHTTKPKFAEGAFSLEVSHRGLGHGTRLFDALLFEAEGAGVKRLDLQCLRENVAMQRIARRFSARLAFEGSETVATIDLPPAALATVGDWPARLPPVSSELA